MSDRATQMVQCRLERTHEHVPHAKRIMTAWIDERGATVGSQVELLPSGEFWEVVAVFNRMSAEVIKETQRQRRQAPPSLRNTIKDKRQQEAMR